MLNFADDHHKCSGEGWEGIFYPIFLCRRHISMPFRLQVRPLLVPLSAQENATGETQYAARAHAARCFRVNPGCQEKDFQLTLQACLL